jgi:hypothetical protein
VLVINDPVALRGPAPGKVVLPLRLFWSPAGSVFDLNDPFTLRSMYQVVLGEAIRAEELISYLNGDKLAAVWPDLHLPKGVRRAWEERHPSLRAARGGRLMPLSELHQQVASIALRATGEHGFAWAAATRSSRTASSTGPPKTSTCSPTGKPA